MDCKSLANISPIIGDIRAAGLFIGVELVRDRAHARSPRRGDGGASSTACAQRHVLISAAGRDANVLKIRPPLVFSKENADLFSRNSGRSFAEIRGR